MQTRHGIGQLDEAVGTHKGEEAPDEDQRCYQQLSKEIHRAFLLDDVAAKNEFCEYHRCDEAEHGEEERSLEVDGGPLGDSVQNDQGDGVDRHGVDREDAISHPGSANEAVEVEKYGEGDGAEGKGHGDVYHPKISFRRAS